MNSQLSRPHITVDDIKSALALANERFNSLVEKSYNLVKMKLYESGLYCENAHDLVEKKIEEERLLISRLQSTLRVSHKRAL